MTTTLASLHGKPMQLHVAWPAHARVPDTMVLYASGDGGWFGAAVDMFEDIARAGYPTVGFSARAFLNLERSTGELSSVEQLVDEYEQILAQARAALGLPGSTRAIVAGWSRGAAFSVLVASERRVQPGLLGLVAIGLPDGEELKVKTASDDPGGGAAAQGAHRHRLPFDTYERLASAGPLPCAVIQSSGDDFLPAAKARALFGADSATRRFYTVRARNHRFSGGKGEFSADLRDALSWVVERSPPPATPGPQGLP